MRLPQRLCCLVIRDAVRARADGNTDHCADGNANNSSADRNADFGSHLGPVPDRNRSVRQSLNDVRCVGVCTVLHLLLQRGRRLRPGLQRRSEHAKVISGVFVCVRECARA